MVAGPGQKGFRYDISILNKFRWMNANTFTFLRSLQEAIHASTVPLETERLSSWMPRVSEDLKR